MHKLKARYIVPCPLLFQISIPPLISLYEPTYCCTIPTKITKLKT
jgi:hypothetical protein